MAEGTPRFISVDAESLKRLEVLPVDYRDLVVASYTQTGESTARYIADGRLLTTYRLPELDTFTERVIALAPTHEAFAVNDWQPEVVFKQRRLSFEQWHNLLSGHLVGDGHMSEGIWLDWGNYTGSPIDPVARMTIADESDLWDVAIISATERPALVNVSPDGVHGPDAEIALAALRGLPGVTDASPGIIKRFSPSHDSYFALQRSRLERGEQPVDPDHTETWTIARENIMVDGTEQSLYLYWRDPIRQVVSEYLSMGYYRGALGVRPTMCGRDLVPRLQPNV